jgi:hypothetical protein
MASGNPFQTVAMAIYPLQVLTECKQNAQFGNLLHRLEKKPGCKGRSLETFLTYPMHQVGKGQFTWMDIPWY